MAKNPGRHEFGASGVIGTETHPIARNGLRSSTSPMGTDPKSCYRVGTPACAMSYNNLSSVELAKLCADNDPAAWREFIRRYRRPIALGILRILRRSGDVSTFLVDDLVQDTYVALCANGYRLLREFVEPYPTSLTAMIRVVAANVTHDYIRSKNSRKRGGGLQQVSPDSFPLDSLYATDADEHVDRAIQLEEIDALLRGLPQPTTAERDRSIFWLHFRFGMSAKAIAQIPSFGLTPKGVESSIYRTIDLVRQALGVVPQKSSKKSMPG
jgi:RNA polymerase sigma-70 factor (ECF subfamily)